MTCSVSSPRTAAGLAFDLGFADPEPVAELAHLARLDEERASGAARAEHHALDLVVSVRAHREHVAAVALGVVVAGDDVGVAAHQIVQAALELTLYLAHLRARTGQGRGRGVAHAGVQVQALEQPRQGAIEARVADEAGGEHRVRLSVFLGEAAQLAGAIEHLGDAEQFTAAAGRAEADPSQGLGDVREIRERELGAVRSRG